MDEPISRHFVSRGLRLHYTDWGNAQAPPLILVHGGRDHSRNWDDVARRLRHRWHIIAPDLRGHGDSAWSPDGDYAIYAFIYDLGQLIVTHKFDAVTLVGHSLGGNIVLNYTALYPETVRKAVAIEGLGISPRLAAERDAIPFADHVRRWMDELRAADGKTHKRYTSIDEAAKRMVATNPRLTPDLARHLTLHGLRKHDDGTYSWKFDNALRIRLATDLTTQQQRELWARVRCPTLLVYGADSWASNPATDGRAAQFPNAKVSLYPGAGHWVQHDQLEPFVAELEQFL